MSSERRSQPGAPPKRDHLDELVDEAEQESFPASAGAR
jgi:hypothetical protein